MTTTDISWQESVFNVLKSSGIELQAIYERFHTRGSVRFLQVLVSAEEHERVMPTRDAVENKLRFCEAISAGN